MVTVVTALAWSSVALPENLEFICIADALAPPTSGRGAELRGKSAKIRHGSRHCER
jgi:hypothetical protein